MSKIAVCYIVHDDTYYLAESIASFRAGGDLFAFVSRVPWSGEPGDWETAAKIAGDAGAEVILGDWAAEDPHRRAALFALRERGYTHVLTPDGDEFIEAALLDHLARIAHAELADRVYIHWNTYWKSPEYVIRPREPFTPLIMLDVRDAFHVHLRDYAGGRGLLLPPEYGLMHHLSYSGPDERILRKISTWGHKDEVLDGWLEHVWYRWDSDKLLSHLHPTHPPNYRFAERIAVPPELKGAWARFQELTGHKVAASCAPAVPAAWPKVSVIIPLHGGVEDVCGCLESLRDCRDLLHETIVVDNASPDGADQAAEEYDFVRLLKNETNRGFSAACNRGAEAATGSVLLFLNSDTVVPRAGLIRLIEALRKSGSIAAAGPYTNRASQSQQIEPTYTSLDTLDRFAEDFAARDVEDVEVDMLVGFCVAVRRSVWEEVGGFDEQFGLGMFEDNDLSYRMRRAGYRLVIAARSFIHHHGSQTLLRIEADIRALLLQNRALYFQKWRDDLESGFASGLAGTTAERLVFDPSRHPDARAKQVAEMARRADISLCMIVKNEERVLADALKSAKPFFREMIVVDTGSTDRTKEIALEAGAKVFDFPWTDSFSAARNESLKHAKGRWIFWMDADDTLPWTSGEALLKSALNAPREVVGFVVPVQFVDDGSTAGGTRVDHVKLFRNLPGVAFEGRIHEQILSFLRAAGGEIIRSEAFVLHSGYDTSPEGQARKRQRDAKLLQLDLQERPDNPFVHFNLGMTDHYLGEHQTAIAWLKKSLALAQPNESIVRKAYALLAISQREAGDPAACLQTLEDGLRLYPEDPELHFHAAMQCTALGQIEEAKAHYLQTLQANIGAHYSSVDMGILGFKTYHNLGTLCLQMGHYREARDWWQKAVEAAPQFTPSAFELFNAALEHDDTATARRMLDAVRAAEGASESWAKMGVRYAEALGDPSGGEEFLRRAAGTDPTAVAPRLLLARRLLEAGREPEAREHLLLLNQQGVAEAAYYLGISCVRHDDLQSALSWMERAQTLNPNHTETAAQITHLRSALGLATKTPVQTISLEAALTQIAADLELDAAVLLAYAEEDDIGGYHPDPPDANETAWPGGSVWAVEGQILYALVRALQPKTIVEVGSYRGCSTSHLAKACLRNGQGMVYAVDPGLDFSQVDKQLRPFIEPVKQDIFTWQPPKSVDFLFEDGTHTLGLTQRVLAHLLPSLRPGAMVCCHDYHQYQIGAHISQEFREVMGEQARSVLIAPSDCGLGYARYVPTSEPE